MPFVRKLTDEQIATIIERRSTGESYQKIAVDFDVSASRIYELTHPEKQAEKAAKLKEKNAAKRAANKAAKAPATAPETDAEVQDMDLSSVDEEAGAEPVAVPEFEYDQDSEAEAVA